MNIILHQLEPTGEIINLVATWKTSYMSAASEYYYLSIHPPPPYGPASWTTTSTSTLSIRNDTVYNITISTCPYRTFVAHFIIGMLSSISVGGLM